MAADFPPLEAEIRKRIAVSGSMSVGQYMALCLAHPEHGYYMTHDPFGASGDFVTAPEISQMFGELLGLWASEVWLRMGSPEKVRLVELGPGRGTMMRDALRAVQIIPAFRSVVEVHLVEISPTLRERQRDTLRGVDVPVEWHTSLDEVPEGPLIVVGNEFIDALPVQQAVMCADGWHERVVRVADGKLQFSNGRDPIPLFDQMLPAPVRDAPIGAIIEWRADRFALELSRRILRAQGAALLIDYGYVQTTTGDTLQAVGTHDFVDPLTTPGQVDLTAHVDFQALAHAGEAMGAVVHGPVQQATFLRNLGIEARAATLKAAIPPEKTAEIDDALDRLTSEEATGMGWLFKVLAISDPRLGPLPGF